jgi:hypothetical protein
MQKKSIAIVESSEIASIRPKLIALKSQASKLLTKWQNAQVKTVEQFESVGQATKDFALIRKELKALIDPVVKKAKADYDAKRKLPKEVDEILEKGEQELRIALIEYENLHRRAREIKIEKALESGKDERAAMIVAKPYIPEVQGLSFVDRWHAEITDICMLLAAIIDSRAPVEAIEPNLVYLNAQARLSKSIDIGIPGVIGVKETSSSIRT